MHLRVLGVVAADLDFLVVDRVRGQDIADALAETTEIKRSELVVSRTLP